MELPSQGHVRMAMEAPDPRQFNTHRLRWFLGLVLLAILGAVVGDWWSKKTLPNRAAQIQVGDDKAQVLAILGEARDTFLPSESANLWERILSVDQETWAYGSFIEWSDKRSWWGDEFPWFFPFKFRLFGPDPDDIYLKFDQHGRVTKVYIPGISPLE